MAEIKDCEDLLKKAEGIIQANEMLRQERKKRGELFNVFSVLGLNTRENAHSDFIAELRLSPIFIADLSVLVGDKTSDNVIRSGFILCVIVGSTQP